MPSNSLPGCIGFFGFPLAPNDCRKCPHRQLCKSVTRGEAPEHEDSK